MKKLIYTITLIALLTPSPLQAQGELKHGIVSAIISGGITELCHTRLKSKTGEPLTYGCAGLGIITTFILGAAFEMAQEDYSIDAQKDLLSNGIGAIIGASIAITF